VGEVIAMAIDVSTGWVMVNRSDGHVMAWTFDWYRRDAIKSVCDMFPTMTRRAVLRRWKPVKAQRTVETAE